MTMKAALLLLAFLLCFQPPARAATPLDPSLDFMREHCLRCHNAEKTKGGLRLDQLTRDFSDLPTAERWSEILSRINAGEMPPEEEKQPPAATVAKISEWIHGSLADGRASRLAKRAPVSLYRLSREEYANTVRDLLGVPFDIDAPGSLNEDPRWRGFNRIGSLLTLSPSHVEKYYDAAQKIISDAFPDSAPQSKKGKTEATTPRAKEILERRGVSEPARSLILPGKTSGSIDARTPGLYRIAIRLSALPSTQGRVPHLVIWDDGLKRTIHETDVDIPEDQPEVIEFKIHLPTGRYSILNQGPGVFEARTLSLTAENPFTHSRDRRWVHPGSYKLFDDGNRALVPLLIVDSVEWEGPLAEASETQKRLGIIPADESKESLQQALHTFLERAWRKPVSAQEIKEFVDLVEKERSAGEKFRNAYLATLVSALSSKNFYYLHEGSPAENRKQLDAWELASRLSYFLWSSMPDPTLSDLARNGTLLQPETLRAQVLRMLEDPKIAEFERHFPSQWLQLHRLGAFPPDAELYPAYDKWLEQSMRRETELFFRDVFRKNLPIREFIRSDWTYLNSRLALHYGLPSPGRQGFQRVLLPITGHRGGILTQASLLTLTSDGVRHRPVHRGVLVSESIFGRTPPPPPPNVEPLEATPQNSPKATVRMQLAAHASNAICASCHSRIDPLGFAFDNFDAIGRWRDQEIVNSGLGENPTVDATGVLPWGGSFDGPDSFKNLLSKDADKFAEALASQLATFALRRITTVDDLSDISNFTRSLRSSDYRLRDLILELVMSDLFRRR